MVVGSGFVVADAAAVLVDPGEGSLHTPDPGSDVESGAAGDAFDDVNPKGDNLVRPADQRLRLRPYLAAMNGSQRQARQLYHLDMKLSSHIHSQLRVTELVVRQQMHLALSTRYGTRWFDQRSFISKSVNKGVDKAYTQLLSTRDYEILTKKRPAPKDPRTGKPRIVRRPDPGKIVAELIFGTWVQPLPKPADSDNEKKLWRPALESCFNQTGLRMRSGAVVSGTSTRRPVWSMDDAMKLMMSLNWARNRVNHCESVVFGFPQAGKFTPAGAGEPRMQIRNSPRKVIEDCRTLVGRFDTTVEAWMRTSTTVDHLAADPLAQVALHLYPHQA
ncbi:hypothetical protein [Rhodococcus sp. MS16]|uniref:hypothetical protein n=1 Tax=Rhodococcus sp. MS16 TaxID=2579941 RepID=UPI001F5B5530|nr:hypothetical protein [Rhodococcus sp. MS16]